jgi:hypothetical protein
MQFELEGSAEELARLEADLRVAFPEQQISFGAPRPVAQGFGSRAPLGEATLLTVVVTTMATTIAKDVATDLYKWIKARYAAVKVKPAPDK